MFDYFEAKYPRAIPMIEREPIIGPNTQAVSGANTTTIATIPTQSCVIVLVIFANTFSCLRGADDLLVSGDFSATFFVVLFTVAIIL